MLTMQSPNYHAVYVHRQMFVHQNNVQHYLYKMYYDVQILNVHNQHKINHPKNRSIQNNSIWQEIRMPLLVQIIGNIYAEILLMDLHLNHVYLHILYFWDQDALTSNPYVHTRNLLYYYMDLSLYLY